MKPIPYVLIKCATTRDGYLDDTSDKRLILSNEKDFAEVEKVRESCDAILVGAETIRKDNPRLVPKSGKKLIKVTITSSGNLDAKSNFFTMGDSEKIVYTTENLVKTLKQKLPNATIVAISHSEQSEESKDLSAKPQDDNNNLKFILEDLYKRGIRRLLVEGGSTIITEFLNENLVDELQISIAPIILGDKGGAKLVKNEITKQLHLHSKRQLDEMVVETYSRQTASNVADTMKQWIEYVINLSKNCPPSDTAFAVGAALVDSNNNLIADGYSRELDANIHAEEVIFEKMKDQQIDFSMMTLYTSLEPCNTRLSKEESCVDLILEHGINRIVYAATEPLVFADANGAKRLREAGKEVINLVGYEDAVIKLQPTSIQEKWKNS